MSYFDYFCNNIINETRENDSIKGNCYDMCPAAEKRLRVKEGLIHILEVCGPTQQLVKCYSRSAADTNMAIPSMLRPFSILQETTQHLLLSVTKRKDVSIACMYDFINDRLRAIRQDITIQRLPPYQCMQLLEPMIRFYVYFQYKLSGSPLNEFDPVLNRKYLLECIKWFLQCNDVLEPQTNRKNNDKDLTALMSNLNMNNKSAWKLSCDRILIESLYLLCNIDDLHPLYRYLSLSSDLRCTPALRLAYKIVEANLHGNYVRTWRLSEKLCPLTFFAFSLYLPTLQRNALRVISSAYSSRVVGVPASVLSRWLGFTGEEAKAACVHYGFKADKDLIQFTKGAFKTDAELFKPKKYMRPRDNLLLEEILTY